MNQRRNSGPQVEVRLEGKIERLQLHDLSADLLRRCGAIRSFRWLKGQRHFPGLYWSATTGSHVGYESRLELARLLLADHDPEVGWIVSQPFRLNNTDTHGRQRRHVPDYALIYECDAAITIVNVKPAERLRDPKVAEALGWAHRTMQDAGLSTEIWSSTDPQVLINLRYIAGFRNPVHIPSGYTAAAVESVTPRATWREAEAKLQPLVDQPRVALLHALWLGRLRCDLYRPISLDTHLEVA
jgi:hypothetical protein